MTMTFFIEYIAYLDTFANIYQIKIYIYKDVLQAKHKISSPNNG